MIPHNYQLVLADPNRANWYSISSMVSPTDKCQVAISGRDSQRPFGFTL